MLRSDGGAFDSNFAFFDCFGSFKSYGVIGSVSVFHTQVIILNGDVQEWMDELVFDHFPDNSGHFISVEVDYWVCDFYLGCLHLCEILENLKLKIFLFIIRSSDLETRILIRCVYWLIKKWA
jgi:hypothetical protein